MAKAPAFQLYAGDFLTDVMDWTDEEVGAHMRLLCWSWVNRRGIPRDYPRMTRIAPAAEKCWPTIGPKWKAGPDETWINEKLESTRSNSDSFRARQSAKSELAVAARKEKGTKVGRKRKPVGQPVELPLDVSVGLPTGNPLEDEVEDRSITQNKKERAHEAELEPTFEQWWILYAKSRDKEACRAKWKALAHDVHVKIMEHTAAYVKAQTDKLYRKDPIRYLTKQAWNDEVINGAGSGPTKTMSDAEYRESVKQAAFERFGGR